MNALNKAEKSYRKIVGPAPSEDRYYVLATFDISNVKKYTLLTKLLKRYVVRIQNSVYEGYVKMSDYKNMIASVEQLMRAEKYFNPDDKVRIYRMSGVCSALIYGPYDDSDMMLEENLFL